MSRTGCLLSVAGMLPLPEPGSGRTLPSSSSVAWGWQTKHRRIKHSPTPRPLASTPPSLLAVTGHRKPGIAQIHAWVNCLLMGDPQWRCPIPFPVQPPPMCSPPPPAWLRGGEGLTFLQKCCWLWVSLGQPLLSLWNGELAMVGTVGGKNVVRRHR